MVKHTDCLPAEVHAIHIQLRIDPQLGDLSYAKGTFPTPHGLVTVCHTRQEDGTIRSDIAAPKEIEIIMG